MSDPAPAPTTPRLLISCAGKMWSVDLTVDAVSIGRSRANTIRLTDKSISAHHCEIVLLDDHYLVIDNGAKNGTLVNGKPVSQTGLTNGDVLQVGAATIRFEAPEKKHRVPAGPLRRRVEDPAAAGGPPTPGVKKAKRPTPRFFRRSTAVFPAVAGPDADDVPGGTAIHPPHHDPRRHRVAGSGPLGYLFSGSVGSYVALTAINLVIVAALIWRLTHPPVPTTAGGAPAPAPAVAHAPAPAPAIDPAVPPKGVLPPVAAAPAATPAAPAAPAGPAAPAAQPPVPKPPAPDAARPPLEKTDEGDRITPPPTEDPKPPPKADPGPAGPAPKTEVAQDDNKSDHSIEFLGVRDEGTHFLFVIDASASMEEPSQSHAGQTKKEVSRRALCDAIEALDPAQSFSVVFFTDESFAMSSRFHRATADNKGVAVNWVKAFKRQGTTNIWSGMERAFEIVATIPEKERSAAGFKVSLFVLSDGKVKEPDRVVQAVKAYVKGKKIAVNAISFDPADIVLKNLAEAGGGGFARQ